MKDNAGIEIPDPPVLGKPVTREQMQALMDWEKRYFGSPDPGHQKWQHLEARLRLHNGRS
jgi:hypothetical protein